MNCVKSKEDKVILEYVTQLENRLEAKKLEVKKLAKRIHNQRKCNRENWMIVEMRSNYIGPLGKKRTQAVLRLGEELLKLRKELARYEWQPPKTAPDWMFVEILCNDPNIGRYIDTAKIIQCDNPPYDFKWINTGDDYVCDVNDSYVEGWRHRTIK